MRYFSDGSPGIVAPLNNSTLPFLSKKNKQDGKMMVYGIFDRYVDIEIPPVSGMVIAVLQPYALTMLTGLSAELLNNRIFNFSQLFPEASAEKRIEAKTDASSVIAEMEDFFCRFHVQLPVQDQIMIHCLALIQERRGNLRVSDIMKTFPLTERQLERKFNQYIGLTPKRLLGLLRIANYLKLIRRAEPGNSALQHALQAGYYDQAHLNNHFKSFTGTTPLSYLRAADPLALNLYTL
ncbi:hypothetical protein GCM10023149_29050 [Mucilaginibacter gynuensis]|uniref:HTH araC/xylS-type domain-containing protein n=2 Tax=Mucilaginibacter gynuensis TaxID=1302236 RepID=A0ABP8GL20_9SPHI